jgi:hypothetical protein
MRRNMTARVLGCVTDRKRFRWFLSLFILNDMTKGGTISVVGILPASEYFADENMEETSIARK